MITISKPIGKVITIPIGVEIWIRNTRPCIYPIYTLDNLPSTITTKEVIIDTKLGTYEDALVNYYWLKIDSQQYIHAAYPNGVLEPKAYGMVFGWYVRDNASFHKPL